MRIPNTIFAPLAVALLCIGSATIAQADTITFTGSREFSGGQGPVPNPVRCGTPTPPIFLVTNPPGVGASNLGSFTSTESQCQNNATGNVFDGLFTFDFGGGNTFFGTYVGTLVGIPPPPTPPGTVLDVSFTYTLTGGTGIFVGASGSLLGTGTITTNPPPSAVVPALISTGLSPPSPSRRRCCCSRRGWRESGRRSAGGAKLRAPRRKP
jgi:hypothetical protein